METNGRIESVKEVGKQMKRSCPVELQLAHVRTALARALGFAHWFELTDHLQKPFTSDFRNRVMKISSDPSHPTFLAAAARFAESSGVGLAVAHALCVEFLPPALAKWQNWQDRTLDSGDRLGTYPEARAPTAMPQEAKAPLLPESASNTSVRLSAKETPVQVVVRKQRQIVKPDR